MQPRLITPPSADLVPAVDLREYLEIDGTYRDVLIMDLQAAALADLQKQTGRCIMAQTWAVDLPEARTFLLPFPDVTSVTASAGTATLGWYGQRQAVTVTEACTVEFTAAMAEPLLAIARLIVRQMVAYRFEHREPVITGTATELPMGVSDLIVGLRWSFL